MDPTLLAISERAISAESVGKFFTTKRKTLFAPKELQSASEYRTNLRAIKKCSLRTDVSNQNQIKSFIFAVIRRSVKRVCVTHLRVIAPK